MTDFTTIAGGVFAQGAVQDSPELRRILSLPRRTYDDPTFIAQVTNQITSALKRPEGTMSLRPIQALSLYDIAQVKGLLAPVGVGHGKAIPNDEPVLTEHGWRPIASLRFGDRIYGSDGRLHHVTGVYPQGVRPVCRLMFSDGSTAVSDVEHLWTFRRNNGPGKRAGFQTKTLREWRKEPLYRQTSQGRAWSFFLPMSKAIEYPEAELPLDPYTLGALIGDGGMSQRTINFTTMDVDILNALVLPEGVVPKKTAHQNSGRATQYNLTKREGRTGGPTPNPLRTVIDDLGLRGTSHSKFIPTLYLRASVSQRVSLLQGLLDTDGECVQQTGVGFSSVSERLIDDVIELVDSLGASCTVDRRAAHTRLRVTLPAGIEPFRCSRKKRAFDVKRRQRPPHRSLRAIEDAGFAECTCISTSAPDKLFHLRRNVLTHNTLISLLAPRVLASTRPLIIVPASLREKTFDDMLVLGKQWFLPPYVRVESYEFLSRVSGADFLTNYSPDAIICDEAHRLKNPAAACTKRVRRYLMDRAEKGVKCAFIAMSGTLTKRSLQDYAHLSAWALGDYSPVPRDFAVLMEWCGALDEGSIIRTLHYGALEKLAYSEHVEDQDSARRAFRDRLVSTPGVIATTEGALDTSLEIDAVIVQPEVEVEQAMSALRTDWELPDGHECVEGVEKWRHAREISLGFYYKWDPWPPEEWNGPRQRWSAEMRTVLKDNRRNIDTDLQLRNAIEARPDWYPKATAAYEEWVGVKDTFVPNTVPVWLSDHVIRAAEKWARKHKGIVWVEQQAFGDRFEDLTGIPCYGEGGLDRRGRRIEHHPVGAPLAARIQSNCTGRNLQAWNQNLVVSPPSSGLTVEQLIGRTHRPGQTEDTVYFTWMFSCAEHIDAWQRCLDDAKYVQDSQGSSQKILYADKTFSRASLLASITNHSSVWGSI